MIRRPSDRACSFAAKGAAATRARLWSPVERERRRRSNARLKPGRNLIPAAGRRLWPAAELALLGTEPDDVIAERFGRTPEAVRVQRGKRGIPTARDRRRRPD